MGRKRRSKLRGGKATRRNCNKDLPKKLAKKNQQNEAITKEEKKNCDTDADNITLKMDFFEEGVTPEVISSNKNTVLAINLDKSYTVEMDIDIEGIKKEPPDIIDQGEERVYDFSDNENLLSPVMKCDNSNLEVTKIKSPNSSNFLLSSEQIKREQVDDCGVKCKNLNKILTANQIKNEMADEQHSASHSNFCTTNLMQSYSCLNIKEEPMEDISGSITLEDSNYLNILDVNKHAKFNKNISTSDASFLSNKSNADIHHSKSQIESKVNRKFGKLNMLGTEPTDFVQESLPNIFVKKEPAEEDISDCKLSPPMDSDVSQEAAVSTDAVKVSPCDSIIKVEPLDKENISQDSSSITLPSVNSKQVSTENTFSSNPKSVIVNKNVPLDTCYKIVCETSSNLYVNIDHMQSCKNNVKLPFKEFQNEKQNDCIRQFNESQNIVSDNRLNCEVKDKAVRVMPSTTKVFDQMHNHLSNANFCNRNRQNPSIFTAGVQAENVHSVPERLKRLDVKKSNLCMVPPPSNKMLSDILSNASNLKIPKDAAVFERKPDDLPDQCRLLKTSTKPPNVSSINPKIAIKNLKQYPFDLNANFDPFSTDFLRNVIETVKITSMDKECFKHQSVTVHKSENKSVFPIVKNCDVTLCNPPKVAYCSKSAQYDKMEISTNSVDLASLNVEDDPKLTKCTAKDSDGVMENDSMGDDDWQYILEDLGKSHSATNSSNELCGNEKGKNSVHSFDVSNTFEKGKNCCVSENPIQQLAESSNSLNKAQKTLVQCTSEKCIPVKDVIEKSTKAIKKIHKKKKRKKLKQTSSNYNSFNSIVQPERNLHQTEYDQPAKQPKLMEHKQTTFSETSKRSDESIALRKKLESSIEQVFQLPGKSLNDLTSKVKVPTKRTLEKTKCSQKKLTSAKRNSLIKDPYNLFDVENDPDILSPKKSSKIQRFASRSLFLMHDVPSNKKGKMLSKAKNKHDLTPVKFTNIKEGHLLVNSPHIVISKENGLVEVCNIEKDENLSKMNLIKFSNIKESHSPHIGISKENESEVSNIQERYSREKNIPIKFTNTKITEGHLLVNSPHTEISKENELAEVSNIQDECSSNLPLLDQNADVGKILIKEFQVELERILNSKLPENELSVERNVSSHMHSENIIDNHSTVDFDDAKSHVTNIPLSSSVIDDPRLKSKYIPHSYPFSLPNTCYPPPNTTFQLPPNSNNLVAPYQQYPGVPVTVSNSPVLPLFNSPPPPQIMPLVHSNVFQNWFQQYIRLPPPMKFPSSHLIAPQSPTNFQSNFTVPPPPSPAIFQSNFSVPLPPSPTIFQSNITVPPPCNPILPPLSSSVSPPHHQILPSVSPPHILPSVPPLPYNHIMPPPPLSVSPPPLPPAYPPPPPPPPPDSPISDQMSIDADSCSPPPPPIYVPTFRTDSVKPLQSLSTVNSTTKDLSSLEKGASSVVTSKCIEKEFLNSEDFLLKILSWNVDWLNQQRNNSDPPPIVEKMRFVYSAYIGFDDYYSTYLRLLLFETWEALFQTWNKKEYLQNYYFSVMCCSKKGKMLEVNCETFINDDEDLHTSLPTEGHLTITKFALLDGSNVTVYGYVTHHTLRAYNKELNSSHKHHQQQHYEQKFFEKNAKVLSLTLKTFWVFTGINLNELARIQMLFYLKPVLKQYDALLAVKCSPLCNTILSPDSSTCHIVSLSKTSDTSRISSVVSSITSAVLKPHPLPQAIVVKMPPDTDKINFLFTLIQHLKSLKMADQKTPLLLCSNTNEGIDEIGFRLINFSILTDDKNKLRCVRLGKEADIHPEMKKFALRHLVTQYMQTIQNQDLKIPLQECDAAAQEVSECETSIAALMKCSPVLAEKLKRELKKCKDIYRDKLMHKDNLIAKRRKYYEQYLNEAQLHILQTCDIILSTVSTCYETIVDKVLGKQSCLPFSCCIIDNANQCTELEILTPILYGISKLVLIGDPNVQAVVLSKHALNYNSSLSLFKRIITSNPQTLKVNY